MGGSWGRKGVAAELPPPIREERAATSHSQSQMPVKGEKKGKWRRPESFIGERSTTIQSILDLNSFYPGRVESVLLRVLFPPAYLELHRDLYLLDVSAPNTKSVRGEGGAVQETSLRLKTRSPLDLPLPYLTHPPYPHRCLRS